MNGNNGNMSPLRDLGPEASAVNIDNLSLINKNYRTALWTGRHLQVTLMSIPAGADIGLEMHGDTDQFIRIESGCATVKMGKSPAELDYVKRINGNFAVMVPAGTWHNIINTGRMPLKLYSVYAPPHHPFGAVQRTKE